MNCVFTIVASNYLALAETLKKSVNTFNSKIDFFIIVADKKMDLGYGSDVLFAEDLIAERFLEMAFRYNVTEFCTSIKPFGVDYLFERGYEKVIYLDPDILVFDNLVVIFDWLDKSSVVLTPHFVTFQREYRGIFPEGLVLHAGIFNLGFIGIRNSGTGRRVIEWWKARLVDMCYQDKIDGYHTDQKWMDFLPSFIDDLHVLRDLGCNFAIWNFHERKLIKRDGKYLVSYRDSDNEQVFPLIFFHFSNFRFSGDEKRFIPELIREHFVDLQELGELYLAHLAEQSFFTSGRNTSYKYNFFESGEQIAIFQRRLYRRLVEEGVELEVNPFNTDGEDSFYRYLAESGLLLSGEYSNVDKLNERNLGSFGKSWKALNFCFRTLKSLLGFKRYMLLTKFMTRYLRPENQTFLIKRIGNDLPFKNENKLKYFK